MTNWYGIKGITYIPHGSWSDPEIEYLGIRVNATIPEDTMWERWTTDDYGNHLPEREKDEKGFCKYMKANASEVKDLIKLAFQPIATKCTCNWGGIAILNIDSDYVISAEHYGDGYLRISKAQIRYTLNGEPYFMRHGRREHLEDYMRTGR